MQAISLEVTGLSLPMSLPCLYKRLDCHDGRQARICRSSASTCVVPLLLPISVILCCLQLVFFRLLFIRKVKVVIADCLEPGKKIQVRKMFFSTDTIVSAMEGVVSSRPQYFGEDIVFARGYS